MLKASSQWPFQLTPRDKCSSKIILSTFLCGREVPLLFSICRCSVGRSSMLAVPEVTVRSVTPIPVRFALAVLRVKRTINPSEEAGGS